MKRVLAQVARAAAPDDGPDARAGSACSGGAHPPPLAAAAGPSAARRPRRRAPAEGASSGALPGASRRAPLAAGERPPREAGRGNAPREAGGATGQAPRVRVMEGVQEDAFRRCGARLNRPLAPTSAAVHVRCGAQMGDTMQTVFP